MGEIGVNMQAFWQPLHKVIYTVLLSDAQRTKQLWEDLGKKLERESQNLSKAFTCAHLDSQQDSQTVGLFFTVDVCSCHGEIIYRLVPWLMWCCFSEVCFHNNNNIPVHQAQVWLTGDVWDSCCRQQSESNRCVGRDREGLSFRKHKDCLTLLANRGNWLESFNVPNVMYPGCLLQNPLWSRTITASSPFLPSALDTHSGLLICPPLSSLISSVSYFFLCLHLSSHVSPVLTFPLKFFPHIYLLLPLHLTRAPPLSPHLPPEQQALSPACTSGGWHNVTD